MPTRREALLGFAASLVGCATLGSCRNSGDAGQLVIANASGELLLTMAELMRQQGFLKASGVTAQNMDIADGSKILGGIVGGSIDVSTMSGIAQIFPAIERGADLKIIAGGVLRPMLGLFTTRDTVNSLFDLEGGVVGSGSIGALTHQLTVALLKQAGVDVAKVRFVNIGSSADIFRGVAAGTIDAGVGPLSAADQPRLGVRLVGGGNMAEGLSRYTYNAAWTSGRAITQRRDALVKALSAYAKLYRFVQSPEAQDAFVRARTVVFPKAPPEEHLAEFRSIQQYRPFATGLVLEPERLEYLQKLNLDSGSQKQMLPFDRVADMSLAKEALALLDR